MPLTPDDLGLGQDTLNQLTSACSSQGNIDPIDAAILVAVAQVDLYTAGYTLAEAHYKRLARALAVYELYRLAGDAIPDKHEKANAAAMAELKDIRDGKFPALAKTGEAAGTVSGGGAKWGGAARIEMRDGD